MSTLVEQTKARKDYHAKWDAIAKEEVQRVEDEDALDKQASSLSLGTDSGPKSEAEAQDKATNKALREAKALWEKRRDEEKSNEEQDVPPADNMLYSLLLHAKDADSSVSVAGEPEEEIEEIMTPSGFVFV